jgi:transposase
MTREPYKSYSREFKIEAVRLAEESDRPVTRIARELGVRQNQIYKWKKQMETHSSKAFSGKGREVDDETSRLKRELVAVREEIEILKKAAAYFARELQ